MKTSGNGDLMQSPRSSPRAIGGYLAAYLHSKFLARQLAGLLAPPAGPL